MNQYKLFCTFCQPEELDNIINKISERYSILYNKIFVLKSLQSKEYICTYNVDTGNINEILSNTISVHRRKESNTLYTINALNILIKSLNNSILDKNFIIPWENYKNCILLVNDNNIKRLDTLIHTIIELN